jgi:hypothetical protein
VRLTCSHPEALTVDPATCRWPMRDLLYFEAILWPGLDSARVSAAYDEACRRIMAVCGVTLTRTLDPDLARIRAYAGKIDGPGDVLALSQLPLFATAATILYQTFDLDDELPFELMVVCMCHEICHCLGLGHSVAGQLMAAYLDGHVKFPQPGDVAELQLRYGPPAASSPPDAPPPASIDLSPVSLVVHADEPGDYELTLRLPASGNYLVTIAPAAP